MKKLGILTIGQSPRTDVTPTFRTILGDSIEIVERGALDSLSGQEIKDMEPAKGDITYITRLKTKQSAKISKSKLLPLLQMELTELEKKTDMTVILCTGDFPSILTTKPILYPDRILVKVIEAILSKGILGLIIPLKEQKDSLLEKWSGLDINIVIEVASPYTKSDFKTAGMNMKSLGAEVIVLDCMGYNETQKAEVANASGLPTILSRSLVSRIAKEYLV
ncbi:protein AroM [Virgibacillus halotolerans]|uniref:AroM family protein n=1 Tax=Virgibacillus halotolerans TaxID=1071053 RepID=UPI00196012FE|nr:protein AroM [Virgibacillus halotolerans]